jgi:ribosomal protein S19E (S16A)
MGIARIRKQYGGRTSKGTRSKHRRDGGGAIIRKCFKQLEEAGLIKTVDKKGRTITNKGISLLDSLANEVFQKRKLTSNS